MAKTIRLSFIGSGFVLMALLAMLAVMPKPATKAVALSLPASAPAAQSKAVITAEEIDSIFENWQLSVNHADSDGVKMSFVSAAQRGWLEKKGDGNSNGSLSLFFGEDSDPQIHTPRANIAGLLVFGGNVKFGVISAPLRQAGNGNMQLTDIAGKGIGKYINPADLVWTCAWIMSSHVGSSKKIFPSEDQWLSVGQGWAAWAEIRTRYSLVAEILRIPLPTK